MAFYSPLFTSSCIFTLGVVAKKQCWKIAHLFDSHRYLVGFLTARIWLVVTRSFDHGTTYKFSLLAFFLVLDCNSMRFKSITGLRPSEQSNLWVQGLERVFIISFFCVKLNFLENLECRSNHEILTTYHCSASLFFSCMSLSISSWTVSYFS